MSTPITRLNHLALIGEELALVWNDGLESYIPLETLRRLCPCAVCQGEADVLGLVQRPERTYRENSFQLRSVRPVGGYALHMDWADGHNSGFYSFDYLRSIPQAPPAAPAPLA